MQAAGKMILLAGAILVVTGLVMVFSDRIPFLGRLPGDLTIRKGNVQIYFPIMTGILLSVVISALLWLFSQWRGK